MNQTRWGEEPTRPMDGPQLDVLVEFRRRRAREAVAAVVLTVSVMAAAVASHYVSGFRVGNLSGAVVVGAVVIVAYGVFHIVNWRCPACGYYLGNRSIWSTPRCDACSTALIARASGAGR